MSWPLWKKTVLLSWGFFLFVVHLVHVPDIFTVVQGIEVILTVWPGVLVQAFNPNTGWEAEAGLPLRMRAA